MPTLGFLKKKRTKDSTGSRDNDSPTSPVKDSHFPSPNSAQSKAIPAGFNFGRKSSGAQDTPAAASPLATPQPQQSQPADSMNPAVQQQHHGAPQQQSQQHHQQQSQPQHTQHNSPHISNLIHPTNQPYNSQSNQQQSQPSQPSQPQQSQASQGQNGRQQSFHQNAQPVVRATKGKYTLSDFTIQRTLGTGSFGRVHLVQSKHNQRFYAVKVLKKAQVVKMKQVEHTNDERRMLQQVKHPFLITLWGTFQDSKNLYMVMDFVEGGELFSLLRKSQVGDFGGTVAEID